MAAGAAELGELGREIVKAAYLKGEFILRSGKKSDRYFDKFLFETDPALLRRLGRHLAELVPADTQLLAAPELGAVLLGGAVSMQMGLPLVLVRKEPKEYGTGKQEVSASTNTVATSIRAGMSHHGSSTLSDLLVAWRGIAASAITRADTASTNVATVPAGTTSSTRVATANATVAEVTDQTQPKRSAAHA